MRILGIDPGSARIGYGLIECTPEGNRLRALSWGVLEVSPKDTAERMRELADRMASLIAECAPDHVGIEKLFFAKNKKTALAVAEARGVIMAALGRAAVPLVELGPAEIKIAVTNYGLADKQTVAAMVRRILRLEGPTGYDDASDALAAALATVGRLRDPLRRLGGADSSQTPH